MNVDEAVRRNNLNENEIRIFREIMRCIDNKEYKATVRQIAKAAYVSTASVVRLAQKLGYLGYGDMMISLKNERTEGLNFEFEDVLTSVLISQTGMLKIDELISDIMSGRYHRIHILGIGYSRIPATYMEEKLEELDFVTTQKSPLDFAVPKPYLMIFISENGETYDLTFIAERCRESGCRMYVISSREESSICRIVPNHIIMRRNSRKTDNEFAPNYFIGNTLIVMESIVSVISSLCRERG